MGIQLDWEVASEKMRHKSAGEDPETKRARRRARLRFVLVIIGVVAILALLISYLLFRLEQVDTAIEQNLRDTVEAEVAALRIGDEAAFLALQHEGNPDWVNQQRMTFGDYQRMKIEQDVRLTGRVVNLVVDNVRARVLVEEIIDGVPYTQVWFYWRFEETGWRHVAPDYTLWGDLRTYQGNGVTIRYRHVDDSLAVEMGLRLEDWIETGCVVMACEGFPTITVDIVPEVGLTTAWTESNPWNLVVPSPFVGRARSDMPFDLTMQIEVATLLAERMVGFSSGYMSPQYPADAYYLRSAVVSWLVGRFVLINTNSFLVESLAQNYGLPAVGRLVQVMQPDTDMSVLLLVTGTLTIDQANLDWRDFLTWRLVTEDELIARRDEQAVLRLYDTNDSSALNNAYARLSANAVREQRVVTVVTSELSPQGVPQLRATVRVGQDETVREEQAVFRLVNGVWLRVS